MKNDIKKDFDELVSDLTAKEVRSDVAQYGDIICVKKTGYYHFGVYINDNRIIHFAPKGEFNSLSEAMKNAVIHETTLKKFLGSRHKLFVCDFAKYYSKPSKHGTKYGLFEKCFTTTPCNDIIKKFQYKLYSPSETVERALSKMGQGQAEYNLASNNCEHFAMWCKTGIRESHQINEVLGVVLPTHKTRPD